jgi:hypothetical protein
MILEIWPPSRSLQETIIEQAWAVEASVPAPVHFQ